MYDITTRSNITQTNFLIFYNMTVPLDANDLSFFLYQEELKMSIDGLINIKIYFNNQLLIS